MVVNFNRESASMSSDTTELEYLKGGFVGYLRDRAFRNLRVRPRHRKTEHEGRTPLEVKITRNKPSEEPEVKTQVEEAPQKEPEVNVPQVEAKMRGISQREKKRGTVRPVAFDWKQALATEKRTAEPVIPRRKARKRSLSREPAKVEPEPGQPVIEDSSKSNTAEAEVTIAWKTPIVEDKLGKLSGKKAPPPDIESSIAEAEELLNAPFEEASVPAEKTIEESASLDPAETLAEPPAAAPAFEQTKPHEETLEEQVLNDSIDTLRTDAAAEEAVEPLPGEELMEAQIEEQADAPEAVPGKPESDPGLTGNLYSALKPLEESETDEEVEEEEDEEAEEPLADDFVARKIEAESQVAEPAEEEPVQEEAQADETEAQLPQDGDYRIVPLLSSEAKETQYLMCRKCGTIINVLNAKRNAKCCKQLMVPLEEEDQE
jgi:hypothetical protein